MRKFLLFSWVVLIAAVPAWADPGSGSSLGRIIVDVGTPTISGYDEFAFLGWAPGCSVSLQYFSFQPTGESIQGFPDVWRVGAVTVAPDDVIETSEWIYRSGGKSKWDRRLADKAAEELLRRGYESAGRVERIRKAQIADQPDLERVIASTAVFNINYKVDWPGPEFRFSRVHYSPLGTCLFLVFRNISAPRKSYDFRLVRILNPGVRRERARAHATNGILLYKQEGDIYAAKEELEIAVGMDPDYALARYYNAMFFALHAQYEECFENLRAAVRVKPDYAEKARKAVEFETLHNDPRFMNILAEAESRR